MNICGALLVVRAAMDGDPVSLEQLHDSFVFLANTSTALILTEMRRQEELLKSDQTIEYKWSFPNS